jgi:DNA-3-methyladenine glycosylase
MIIFRVLSAGMPRFPRGFFARYTPEVAKDILGSVLVRRIGGKVLSGRIVETEAYRGSDDPASHAFRGMSERTQVMFGKPGFAYVYFIYGNHYSLNVTTEAEGEAGAVLVRALAPLRGIVEMRANRGKERLIDLTSGPGKLAKALVIDRSLNGEDLINSKKLFLLRGEKPERIGVSRRIGLSVAQETEWRYYVEGDPFVSRQNA